ncbi:peptidase m75, imelysin [Reichenbachiella agarivorans]|uniref:Peptidase m75, imelysin n=1 Tax=Reichenbachiella agarivorans TaxID=2979464 RepID=A0ABY6CNR4_9BACT|nr:imelysin family protein [Reichenbachiella agarivorans]UXP31409.1 peptidase m75, imelysin [Reichenbachiella agarivorans]
MNLIKSTKFFTLIILAFAVASCDSDNDNGGSALDDAKAGAIAQYATIVHANYSDAHTDAVALQTAIDALVASPSETTLEAAKDAWLSSRETYGQTEAFRFYGGPIDDEDGPEGQLNAWPLDESYIDYVIVGDEPVDGTNIINSPNDFPEITAEILAGLNEQGSETNISTGYHAIEFLLWGQDLSEGAGGGERPYTDYVTDGSGTNANQERRANYLVEVTKLLVNDLSSLVSAWEEGASYRVSFESSVDESIENIVSALGKLSKGELAGERMFVAYDLQSKEDEHSCFSDNTHRDIVTNALGIQNVFLGSYGNLTGPSIYDVIAMEDEELANELKVQIASSVELCEAIQDPFDQEFLNEAGRTRIFAAITSLRAQGDQLAEAASALGFEFDPTDI